MSLVSLLDRQSIDLLKLERINKLISANQFLPALTALMQLVAKDMNNAQLWLHVGLIYTRMADWRSAIRVLETVLEINPQETEAQYLLSLAWFSTGRKKDACDLIDKVVKKDNLESYWAMRAYLHAHTSRDPMKALQTARDWGKRFADPLTRNAKPLKIVDRSPRKKLKVGYVTADFRQHSVAFFMLPVLSHHDYDNVEVHVYFNGPADHITAQMRPLVPHWHDIQDLSDEELNQQIRVEGIDVLVDLSGYTQGNRLGVFARRAAPVQVTWLGYMQTLGMKAMDYRLVSRGIAPPSHASYYSETLFHMPGMACYAPPAYAPLCKEPPMLRNGYPTLISLNNSAKITDDMLRVWAQILNRRKNARLLIMVKEQDAEAAQSHMHPRVEAAGMPLERVSVLHQQPLDNFMELGHVADIALDTSPISGGTTTLHTLWMGMPIVAFDAIRGVDASTARMLRGVLSPCGIVVNSDEDYINAAIDLIDDPKRLIEIRATSRDLLKRSGLMNYSKRTKDIEKSFRLMWLNYLIGQKKVTDVSADLNAFVAEIEFSV